MLHAVIQYRLSDFRTPSNDSDAWGTACFPRLSVIENFSSSHNLRVIKDDPK